MVRHRGSFSLDLGEAECGRFRVGVGVGAVLSPTCECGPPCGTECIGVSAALGLGTVGQCLRPSSGRCELVLALLCDCECDSVATVAGAPSPFILSNFLAIAHCRLKPTRQVQTTEETNQEAVGAVCGARAGESILSIYHGLEEAPFPTYKPRFPSSLSLALSLHIPISTPPPILQVLSQSPPQPQLASSHFHKCLISRCTPSSHSTNPSSLPPVCKAKRRVCPWLTNLSTFYLPGNLY